MSKSKNWGDDDTRGEERRGVCVVFEDHGELREEGGEEKRKEMRNIYILRGMR